MSLREAADAYARVMPPGALWTFRVDGLDRLGVPVVAASLLPDDPRAQALHGTGHGATEEEARAGALGKLAEEACSAHALRALPRIHDSYAELVRLRGTSGVADPLTLGLPAGSPYHPDLLLTWVEVERLFTGERVLVPEECVASAPSQLQGRSPLLVPVGHGRGAGMTRHQALAHGLLELVQRDGNGLQFRALDQGHVVRLEETRLPQELRELLARFRDAGIELIPKLAGADFGIVNLYVVGYDPGSHEQPLMVTACGEAADPDRHRALRDALLEYAASRAHKAFSHGPLEAVARVAPPDYLERIASRLSPALDEERALRGMTEWARMSATELRDLMACTLLLRSEARFAALHQSPAADASATRCALVVKQLHAAGFDILVADLSPADHAIHVVKAIVPGLEVETMTHHRIGERNAARLLARKDPLVGFSRPPEGARRVRLTPAAEQRLGGPVWFNSRRADQRLGRLYPLYREPGRHAAQALLRARRFGRA